MSDWEKFWWAGGILLPSYIAMSLPWWVELLVGLSVLVVLEASWTRVERLTNRRTREFQLAHPHGEGE
jgi:hypothetical protein